MFKVHVALCVFSLCSCAIDTDYASEDGAELLKQNS
jgi:hypothetical protein